MKAGIAYVHDVGMRQDHYHHSFGNYITIDHGNGEFSHYAHLATGTVVVSNGEPVEQGQALAQCGQQRIYAGRRRRVSRTRQRDACVSDRIQQHPVSL